MGIESIGINEKTSPGLSFLIQFLLFPKPLALDTRGIRLIGPQSEQHNEVLMRIHFHNGGEQYMLLNPSGLTNLITGRRGNLFVPEGGGTAYVFCVDDNIRDNSGEVKVVFNRRRF